MLFQLQENVDIEEHNWKKDLAKMQSEVDRLRGERDDLAKKNHSLKDSLKVVKQAEEVLLKICWKIHFKNTWKRERSKQKMQYS